MRGTRPESLYIQVEKRRLFLQCGSCTTRLAGCQATERWEPTPFGGKRMRASSRLGVSTPETSRMPLLLARKEQPAGASKITVS